jgi:predicted DNA-binding transcriptional regulator YafY
MKKRTSTSRRGPAGHITLARAARLHRLVTVLGTGSRGRDELLGALAVGLRTFYRELELLSKCGIKVRLDKKKYQLKTTVAEAEGRLPFPDPQLSFSEMAELSRGTSDAARRLASLLATVIDASQVSPRPKRAGRKPKG